MNEFMIEGLWPQRQTVTLSRFFKVRHYAIPTDPMNESSISYPMFSLEDDKDSLFNPAMSCYLLMTTADKCLLFISNQITDCMILRERPCYWEKLRAGEEGDRG